MTRKPYSTDVSNEEWAFVAPYLTLMTEDAQREHSPREVFNGVGWIVCPGEAWRLMPHDLVAYRLPTNSTVAQSQGL